MYVCMHVPEVHSIPYPTRVLILIATPRLNLPLSNAIIVFKYYDNTVHIPGTVL